MDAGEELKSEQYTKFLRVMIDSHLTFSHHVDHIIGKNTSSVVLIDGTQKIATPEAHSEEIL